MLDTVSSGIPGVPWGRVGVISRAAGYRALAVSGEVRTVAACPFCEIVGGERKQPFVYEDAVAVGFMCVPPATPGHVLVVPRVHVADFWRLDEELAAHLMRVAHRLGAATRRALAPIGLNVRLNSGRRAGQDVSHVHVHLVPRFADDTVQPGCVWGEPPWVPPPGGARERARIAARIRAALA